MQEATVEGSASPSAQAQAPTGPEEHPLMPAIGRETDHEGPKNSEGPRCEVPQAEKGCVQWPVRLAFNGQGRALAIVSQARPPVSPVSGMYAAECCSAPVGVSTRSVHANCVLHS
ncbi:hypothetical protein ANO11243_002100 [Dothideomycetidae sp. 11243]|nr:hypothetical protein ANO11243_002100 [fungal sp. No.11243]